MWNAKKTANLSQSNLSRQGQVDKRETGLIDSAVKNMREGKWENEEFAGELTDQKYERIFFKCRSSLLVGFKIVTS